jgi:hypothetical protein
MKAMLLKKLVFLVVGVVAVTTAFGVAGVGYRVAGFGGTAQAAPPDKPLSEVEALRKEVELLRLNIQIVLEKVRSQEGELQAAKKQVAALEARPLSIAPSYANAPFREFSVFPDVNLPSRNAFQAVLPYLSNEPNANLMRNVLNATATNAPQSFLANQPYLNATVPPQQNAAPDAVREAECALKALRDAKDKDGRRRATEALEKAMKKLKEQLK